jgi:hypothetical protein
MKPALTESQVKALLLAAAGSPEAPSPRPYADLVERAVSDAISVQELVELKERAKDLLKRADDARHRDAAQLLYHVTVVAAFVRHGAEISGRPMHKQQQVYERFADAWSGHTIGRLFGEALRRMEHHDTSE